MPCPPCLSPSVCSQLLGAQASPCCPLLSKLGSCLWMFLEVLALGGYEILVPWSAASSLIPLLNGSSMVKSVPASAGSELPAGQHPLRRQGEEFRSQGFTFCFLPSLQYKLQAVSLLPCCSEHPSASQHG